MDVFSLHQAGFDNAVASLGTALTPEQALLLKRYFEEVCLVYDSDTAGTNAARRAIPILEDAGLRVRVMRVPGAKDPDEFIKANGAQAFEELIEKAMDPVDFELAISDTHTLEGQIETMKKMRDRLMRIQDDGERELHIRDVAARLGISQETLAKQVEEERRNFGTQEYRQARQVMIRGNRNTHTDGLEQTQVQLLALLLQYPDSRTQLFSQVSPADFPEKTPEKEGKEAEENIFRRAAQYIFDKRQERIVSADLINLARDEEEQKKLTRIVTEELPKTREELEKLAVETIRRLRQVALDEQLRGARQAEELQQIIQQKKQLEKLEIHL